MGYVSTTPDTAVQSGQMAIRDTNGVGTFFGGTGVGLLSDS